MAIELWEAGREDSLFFHLTDKKTDTWRRKGCAQVKDGASNGAVSSRSGLGLLCREWAGPGPGPGHGPGWGDFVLGQLAPSFGAQSLEVGWTGALRLGLRQGTSA